MAYLAKEGNPEVGTQVPLPCGHNVYHLPEGSVQLAIHLCHVLWRGGKEGEGRGGKGREERGGNGRRGGKSRGGKRGKGIKEEERGGEESGTKFRGVE